MRNSTRRQARAGAPVRLAALLVVALVAAACGSREVVPTAEGGQQPGGQAPAADTDVAGEDQGSRELADASTPSSASGATPGTQSEASGAGEADAGGTGGEASQQSGSQSSAAPGDSGGGGGGQNGQGSGGDSEVGAASTGGGGEGRMDTGVTADTIRVGNMTSYSGPLAGQFDGGPQGAAAYFRMLNEQGGWRGRQFEFITVDDGADGTQGRAQAQRLVEEEEVFALVGNSTLAEWGSAEYLREQGVPSIGTTPSTIGCSEPNQLPCMQSGEWWYNTHNDQYMCEEGIFNDVAVFWIAVDESRQQAQGVIAALEEFGCNVVYEFEAAPAQPDYTPAIAQARANGADSVYTVMEVFSNARLRRDMHRQGWEAPYFGFVNYDQRYLDQTGPAANGTYAPLSWMKWMYDEDHPGMVKYLENFRRYFPDGIAEEVFAARGWTSARLFVEQGLERLGDDITREGLLEALYQTRQWTADDFYYPIDIYPKDNQRGQQAATRCGGLVKVEGGEYTLEVRETCESPIQF